MTLSTDTHTLTVDGTAVKIPAEVDLSPYAKSADVEKEIDQKLGSIPAVDLTDYVKKADLDDYARKFDIKPVPEIKLDAAKRTLTIAGQEIDIPGTVDLSQYARVEDLPKVVLDVEKRVITVDGKSIDVPASMDLSGYVTKSEMSAEIGKVASGGKIDLTGYVTKADADATYETKADALQLMPRTIANNIFAKKADLPKVTYDTTTREMKFTQNGAQPVIVTIPAEVDLSPYLKAATAEATYAKKSDISAAVDLTPYLKSSDADTKYVAKSDLADYAKKTDLSNYVTAATFNENVEGIAGQIPQIAYDSTKHTLNVNGTTVAIPQEVDMSAYLKAADAEKEFAKKSDVPSVVLSRDSDHLWINGQDLPLGKYAKKSDIQNAVQNLPTISANGNTLTFSIPVPGESYNNIYTVDTSKLSGSGENVTYDATNNVLHVGAKEIHPVLQSEIGAYMQKSAAETEFAKKSDVPTITRDNYNQKFVINGYDVNDVTYNRTLHEINIGSNTVDIPNANDYAELDYVNSTFARKENVPAVSYDTDKKQLTVNGKTIDLSGSGSSSSSSLWFKSDAVNTSITWTYNGHTGYQTPISSLTGKGGDAATAVNAGDVVIDGTGKAFTVYGSTSDGKAQLIAIGLTAGKGVQTKNISDWNAYNAGLGTAPMQYIGKASIKDALQLADGKTYTMDLDAGTLVNDTDKVTQKLLPGIYQLRDLSTDVNNLTVKSDSSFGGNGGTPVQVTITPYEIDVVLVNGADVSKAWRSCWLADQSSWYGVTDKWHIEK